MCAEAEQAKMAFFQIAITP